MIRKMTFWLLTLFLIQGSLAQFGQTLSSISKCLGDCLECSNDELTTCSSCVNTFSASGCSLSSAYIKEEQFISSQPASPLHPNWDFRNIKQCYYLNSQQKQVNFQVLGFYSNLYENSITFNVEPFYENAVLYFNLIRSSWAPFSDLLRVGIELQGLPIDEYFIEYETRDVITAERNKIVCDGTLRISEKFQVTFKMPKMNKTSQLKVVFEGMVFSGANWGLTNVKVAYGCNNFLTYDDNEKSCSICQNGFYMSNTNKECMRCHSQCTLCSSEKNCMACEDGFSLFNNSCKMSEKSVKETLTLNGTKICNLIKSTFNGNQTILRGDVIDKDKVLINRKMTIIADIAHIPKQWTQKDMVEVWINGEFYSNVSVEYFAGLDKGKKICQEFNPLYGFYSLDRLQIADFVARKQQIIFEIRVSRNFTLGFESLRVSFSQKEEVKEPETIMPPAEPENTIIPKKEEETAVLPEPEPPVPVVQDQDNTTTEDSGLPSPTNSNETDEEMPSNNSGQEGTKTSRQLYIEELVDNKERLVFEVESSKDLLIRVTHPFFIEDYQNFPYFVVEDQDQRQYTCTIIQSSPSWQMVQVDLRESLKEAPLKISVRNIRLPPPSDDLILVAQSSSQEPYIKKQIGSVLVKRFDFLDEEEWLTVERCAAFFEVIAWITIVSTIVSSFLGSSIVIQEFSLLLQIVFLHLYIATQYLPVTFKYSLAGLSRMQDLNYFIQEHRDQIEDFILPDIVQASPLKFTLFGHRDINFSRSMYPTLIISVGYFIWFMLLNLLRKCIEPGLIVSENLEDRTVGEKLKLMIIRKSERVLNFWQQIWQQQAITVLFAVFIQLHNFKYPEGQTGLQVPNFIFCFAWLLLILLLPPLTMTYLNKRYFRLDYFEYCYWYENVFFLKLPEESLPSNHHRVAIVIKNARILFLLICFAYLGSFPIQALIIICIINAIHYIYLATTHLEIDPPLAKFNFVEHLLLIILAVLMMISYGVSDSASSQVYLSLGNSMLAMAFLLFITGICRVFYLCGKKLRVRQAKDDLSEFKPAIATERVV